MIVYGRDCNHSDKHNCRRWYSRLISYFSSIINKRVVKISPNISKKLLPRHNMRTFRINKRHFQFNRPDIRRQSPEPRNRNIKVQRFLQLHMRKLTRLLIAIKILFINTNSITIINILHFYRVVHTHSLSITHRRSTVC